MKIYTYQRKSQFSEITETWVGVKDEAFSLHVDVYHPISFNNNGTFSVMTGISHTNTENVKELTRSNF